MDSIVQHLPEEVLLRTIIGDLELDRRRRMVEIDALLTEISSLRERIAELEAFGEPEGD